MTALPSASPRASAPPPRAVPALLAYLAAALVGGALLAPWLYFAVQWLAGVFPAFETLSNYTFRRYVHRSIVLMALVGMVPFVRAFGVRSREDLGLFRSPGRTRDLALGAATGVGVLAGGTLLIAATGARRFAEGLTPGAVVAAVGVAFASAVAVAVIEEVLFRGVLLGAVRRGSGFWTAAVATSVLYAILHFFGAPKSPQPIVWSSGLAILPGMLEGLTRVEDLVPAFFTLTLAGVALAVGVMRTGSLAFAIGLHAGWVFWVRGYGLLTEEAAGAARWLWGSDILVDGWLALVAMALTLAGVLARLPERSRPAAGVAERAAVRAAARPSA